MNEKQFTDLARALVAECSAQTLGLLGEALTAAQGDNAIAAGLRVTVEAARELRQDAEKRTEEAAPRTLSEALTRDRATGRR